MNLKNLSDFLPGIKAMQHQIDEIKAKMNDPAFRPAKRTTEGERIKAQRKEEKRIRTNQLAAARRAKALKESEQAVQQKSIAKRVKEIVKARRNAEYSKAAPLPVGEGHIKLTRVVGKRKFEIKIGGPDLTGCTPVQVDHKTWIYVKAGLDIQQAIAKYRNRHNLPPKNDTSSSPEIEPGEIARLVALVEK